MKIRNIKSSSLAAICLFAFSVWGNSPIIAQSFKLSAVSDMVRVFEDGYKLPPMHDSIKIFGIRGDIISGQLVISAKKDLGMVTANITELKNSAGNILPSGNAELKFVGSVPLTKNTDNQPASFLTRQAPARFPEYLMDEKELGCPSSSPPGI